MKNKRIFKNQFYIGLCVLFIISSMLYAKEEVDHFILPETPPTIERTKKMPIDKPQIRKENFISDNESYLDLPAVLPEYEFNKFYLEDYPVFLSCYHGSFSSIGSSFIFSSKKGYKFNYQYDYSDGESKKLKTEKNKLLYSIEANPVKKIYIKCNADFEEDTIWNQQKSKYNVKSDINLYLKSNFNMKADFFYSRGEIKNIEINESFNGTVSSLWSPVDGHNIIFSVLPVFNTAFTKYRDFTDMNLHYSGIFMSNFVLGAGCNYQDGIFFPKADIIWSGLPHLRLSINYEPRMERLSWAELYVNNKYVNTSPDLIFPEKRFYMAEKLAYYFCENSNIELEAAQSSVYNYIYWKNDSLSEYISPENFPENYNAALKLNLSHKGKFFAPDISFTYNSNSTIPFVPETQGEVSCDFYLKSWTLTACCNYISDRYIYLNNKIDIMAAYTDFSASIKKSINKNLEIYVSGRNLSEAEIENQPGFKNKAIIFRGGINMRF